MWSDRSEHIVSKGAAESTNQNQITLSTAVTLRPFTEEWGRKSSTNAQTKAQTKRRKTEMKVDRQINIQTGILTDHTERKDRQTNRDR